MEKTYYLPAEWHKQSYIQLTWPHADTDWAYMLDEVEACFVRLATEIASRQPLFRRRPLSTRITRPPAPVARGSRISGSPGRLPLS